MSGRMQELLPRAAPQFFLEEYQGPGVFPLSSTLEHSDFCPLPVWGAWGRAVAGVGGKERAPCISVIHHPGSIGHSPGAVENPGSLS